jgi:hypothetical protein
MGWDNFLRHFHDSVLLILELAYYKVTFDEEGEVYGVTSEDGTTRRK